MAFYSELTTVADALAEYLDVTSASDNPLFLSLIRSVSSEMARAAERQFVPTVETRYFDPSRDVNADGHVLLLDKDLLAVTTLTNGDTDVLTVTTDYILEPRNATPYWGVRLLGSGGISWQFTSDPENAISLLGIWGYHADYSNAWVETDTLGVAITSATAGSATTTGSGLFKAGQLVKIDTEFMYVTGDVTTTLTLVRGVNGSTAATHLISAPIYVWTVDYALSQLAMEASAARYRLRNNPLADTFIAEDGTPLATPKDVSKYLERRVMELGLKRVTLA